MSRIEAPRDEATSNLTDRLLAGLPPEAVLTDPDVTASYTHDMASFCPAGAPAVVVLPRTVEQVQHVMRTASELRVPVVPQGARTGLSAPPTPPRAASRCPSPRWTASWRSAPSTGSPWSNRA